jgi:hypothetical protein
MNCIRTKSFFPKFVQLIVAFLPTCALGLPSTERLFNTELEAVRAASNLYNPVSIREDREYMGSIYKSGNYYGYTVFAAEPGANRISIQVPPQQWDSVVAFWHTHGDASPMKRFFSRFDTRLVKQTGKPLYLADFTGALKVFRPQDRPLTGFAAQRYGLPGHRGFALGTEVQDSDTGLVSIATGNAPAVLC